MSSDLLQLVRITAQNAASFLALTPPAFQPRLRRMEAEVTAVGAVQEGRPVGMVLAEYRVETRSAHLLSIFIPPAHRRSGLGTHLLRAVEAELARQGCQRITVEFMERAEEISPFDPFFQSCGYASPRPGIYLFRGPVRHLLSNEWVTRCRQLPARFTVDPWASTTAAEREAIRQGENVWYPPLLSPFVEEAAIDPALSLVLRDRGEVAGWLIAERMGEAAVLYKTMFVKPRHQRMGRGLSLFAEGIHRMVRVPGLTEALCFVEQANTPMLRSMRHRIMGADSQAQILYRTHKTLSS